MYDNPSRFGDAVSAISLGIAFLLARRKPCKRLTCGYGRVEDLAGVAIVFVILFSAVVARYESIQRISSPKRPSTSGWSLVRRGGQVASLILLASVST